MNITKHANNRSEFVIIGISPYPIVVIVYIAQYIQIIYRELIGTSYKLRIIPG